MAYQVLGDDGSPLDAHFEIDGQTIIFHSRGGSKGKDARNVHYTPALRLLIERIKVAGHFVQSAWVDSSRVQSLPLDERMILDASDSQASPAEQVSRMASRMQAIGRESTSQSSHGNATKRIRLQLTADVFSEILPALRSVRVEKDFRSEQRLPAFELERVTPEHLWSAAQQLLQHRHAESAFRESTDYDVILNDGRRVPPKALFGIAASEALGFVVKPQHFAAGLGSPCFRIIENAGYQIIAKTEELSPEQRAPQSNPEWLEGGQHLRKHLGRERAPGLSAAKKAEFRRTHGGKLLCERCGQDPVTTYKTLAAEACIEVHHSRVQVADMTQGHVTRLEDLQCLCANCHRIVHYEIRQQDAAARAIALEEVLSTRTDKKDD